MQFTLNTYKVHFPIKPIHYQPPPLIHSPNSSHIHSLITTLRTPPITNTQPFNYNVHQINTKDNIFSHNQEAYKCKNNVYRLHLINKNGVDDIETHFTFMKYGVYDNMGGISCTCVASLIWTLVVI